MTGTSIPFCYWWRTLRRYWVVLPLSCLAALANSQVLSLNGAEISERDIANYTREMLKEEVRASGLKRPNVVLQMTENLYVLNRAAAEAESLGLLQAEDIEWYGAYAAKRKALDAFRAASSEGNRSNAELETMAKEFYLANPDEFVKSEEVNVDHILVDPSELTWSEVIERVEVIRDRIAAGENFKLLAAEFSDDPSAEMNSGSLGFVARGRTDPAFEKAAFAMSVPGEISEPIVSSFGIHIIRFNGYKAPTKAAFDEVRVILRERMREQVSSADRRSALEEFKKEISPYLADIDQQAILEAITPIVLQ